MNKNKWAAMVAISLLLAGQPAFALESDRSKPIEIEADQGTLDQKNQVTVFSGNVIIKQGTLNIRAGNVRVSRDKSGQQHIQASGSPVRFGQQLDGAGNKGGQIDGQANNVDYSSATGVVKLSGNAQVQRGGDRVQGNTIIYNTRTEVYTVSGSQNASGKSGKRVTVVIQPQK